MQLIGKKATSDLHVIYDFIKMLSKEVEQQDIQQKPACTYNCDESGFSCYSSKYQYIGPVSKLKHDVLSE